MGQSFTFFFILALCLLSTEEARPISTITSQPGSNPNEPSRVSTLLRDDHVVPALTPLQCNHHLSLLFFFFNILSGGEEHRRWWMLSGSVLVQKVHGGSYRLYLHPEHQWTVIACMVFSFQMADCIYVSSWKSLYDVFFPKMEEHCFYISIWHRSFLGYDGRLHEFTWACPCPWVRLK